MSEHVKRKVVDWDACHRDFRTGKFTQRELADKYGVTHGAVGKKIRENNWQKDLTAEIRQATNARLTQELVANEVAKNAEKVAEGIQSVAKTVSVAAEMNVQVIRGQHRRLKEMDELYADAARLAKRMLSAPGDTKDSIAAVQAMGTVFSTGKGLTELESKVFKLDAVEEVESDESRYIAIIRAKKIKE